jgi:membrane protease YdiL (CAAX protease family)
MNHLPSEQLISDPAIAAKAPTVGRTTLIWVAWIATLLLSNLPLVIARDVLGSDIPWMAAIWLGTAALLIAGTYAWPALQPLRRYFAIMGVIVFLTFVVAPLVSESAAWQRITAGQPEMVVVFSDRILLILRTLVVLLVLFLMGYSRREAFLTPGDMSAPVQGLKLPGGRRLSWAIFGPVMSLLLAGLFFLILLGMNPGLASGLAAAIFWLPLILISAALNAFGEEASFRAAPLATLLPAVGGKHAIWLTAVWFGLGHYYGAIPSGPMGAIGVGLLALLLGKAMLDTRGIGWPFIIHMAIDTVIYLSIAAGS